MKHEKSNRINDCWIHDLHLIFTVRINKKDGKSIEKRWTMFHFNSLNAIIYSMNSIQHLFIFFSSSFSSRSYLSIKCLHYFIQQQCKNVPIYNMNQSQKRMKNTGIIESNKNEEEKFLVKKIWRLWRIEISFSLFSKNATNANSIQRSMSVFTGWKRISVGR